MVERHSSVAPRYFSRVTCLIYRPAPRRASGSLALGPVPREDMPRQNRVTPSGEILATPERGTLMGNRGVLHNHDGRIVRPWQLKRWIVCVLDFKGRRR